MGGSTWSDNAYKHISSDYSTKSKAQIFTNNKTTSDMSPHGLSFRESRDSDAHPNSLAVMVWLDETGSMGRIPERLVKEKLGALMSTLVNHGLPDVQVFFGAIGDHISDKYYLQVGQFESGHDELTKWLTEVYLEGNGGGQKRESYLMAWLVAGRHTSIDCYEKRGQKGVLFTIGDEMSWDNVGADKLRSMLGYTEASDVTDKELLAEAQRLYHVFHIHCNEGGYRDDQEVLGYWQGMLGERLIVLDDHENIAEVIATTVAVMNGLDKASILSTFDKSTALAVSTALAKVNTGVTNSGDGIIKF